MAAEQDIIEKAQTNAFWAKISDSSFDELGDRLAPFMKFREGRDIGGGPVTLNLKDMVHKKEFVEFGPEHEAISVAKYREMVEKRITGADQRPIPSYKR